MPPPTNISAGTATVISTTQTLTQRVDDSGTTYDVWFKFTADFDGVVGIWAFGDLTTYKPGYFVYYNDGVTQLMNYHANPNNDATWPNRPFYIPVTSGITYYLEIDTNSGNPSPANLTLSTIRYQTTGVQAGDFISNRETDDDYEHPMTVSSGSSDDAVTTFVQVAPPLPSAVTSVGLPHGHYGAILPNGNFLYEDDSFGTAKIFSAFFSTVATITTYEGKSTIVVGSNPKAGFFYVASEVGIGTFQLDQLREDGTQTNTWTLTGVTSLNSIAVNDDASFAFYGVQATNSTFKKISLSTFTVTTLDTVTGNNVEDCLFLQDGTILVVYYTNSGAPTTVIVKHYQADGTVLNTYTFGGALYRNEFNPPRIGYALDSPASFWITLKPQSDFGQSLYKNIKISDGSVLATRTQANYLFGQYIGAATSTPPARFGPEKSGALLVMPVGGAPPPVFIGSPASLSIRRERTLPIPKATGNARQTLSRLELQFQPGTGLASDPTVDPKFFARISWNNGKTWSNERLMSVGRTGAYVTRAFLNVLGAGRYPVVQIVATDAFLPVMTAAFVWTIEGVH